MRRNHEKLSYSELIMLPTYKERFEYLKLDGQIGKDTFGFDRYLNQIFYSSREWKDFRTQIILRDECCDLGVPGYDIFVTSKIRIHHLNPITVEDVKNRSPNLFDLDNVITTTLKTHNAIHYGDAQQIFTGIVERSPNDICPWRK